MASISLTIWLHLVAANVLIFPATIAAHSGGLDAYGCHHDRKASGYHCHHGPLAGKSFRSKAEIRKALEEQSPKRSSTKTPKPTSGSAQSRETSKELAK